MGNSLDAVALLWVLSLSSSLWYTCILVFGVGVEFLVARRACRVMRVPGSLAT